MRLRIGLTAQRSKRLDELIYMPCNLAYTPLIPPCVITTAVTALFFDDSSGSTLSTIVSL